MKKSKQQQNPEPESGKKMEKDSSESLKVAVEVDPVDLGKLDPDLYGDGPQGPLKGMESQLIRIYWSKFHVSGESFHTLGAYEFSFR